MQSIFFVLLFVSLLINQIRAPSSSGGSAAPKLQRVQSFKASTRDFEVQRRRTTSSSSASSLYSHVKTDEQQGLTNVNPLHSRKGNIRENRNGLNDASSTTYSGGNLNPNQHGVYARIRNAIFRHAVTFTGGAGVGLGASVGVNAINNFIPNNSSLVFLHRNETIANAETEKPFVNKEVENSI